MKVICTGFRYQESGKLKGFADLLMEDIGLTLVGCPVFEDNVAVPAQKIGHRYVSMAVFTDKETQEAFEEAAGDAVMRHQAELYHRRCEQADQ